VVSFTPWTIYPNRKSPWYTLDRRVGGPQNHMQLTVTKCQQRVIQWKTVSGTTSSVTTTFG